MGLILRITGADLTAQRDTRIIDTLQRRRFASRCHQEHSAMTLEQLIAQARQRTGLDRFPHPDFEEPCRRLIHSLCHEARLTPSGFEQQRERLLELLSDNLRLADWLQRHPEINAETLVAPIVIVGLPRTGSTLLQRLLAQDPSIYCMYWYEGRFPVPLCIDDPPSHNHNPGSRTDGHQGEDERLLRARREIDAILASAPEIGSIQPIDPLAADEEIMLLEHTFYSTLPESMAHVPSYGAWLETQDHRPAYRQLKQWLQFLQWRKRRLGERRSHWVLKTPHHVHHLRALLSVFPDARIVQTHRDPHRAVPSLASMIASYWSTLSDTVDRAQAGQYWCDKFARGMQDCMAVRDAHPNTPFADVHYDTLVKEPLQTIRTLYRSLGRELSAAAEQSMDAWLAANPRSGRPAHRYEPVDYGLSRERIERLYGPYIRRFIQQ